MNELPPGHDAAADRLREARGSIYAAFDSLGLGFEHEEAVAYLEGSPSFAAMCTRDSKQLPCPVWDARTAGLLTGIVLGFALTAVEADRERRVSAPGGDK